MPCERTVQHRDQLVALVVSFEVGRPRDGVGQPTHLTNPAELACPHTLKIGRRVVGVDDMGPPGLGLTVSVEDKRPAPTVGGHVTEDSEDFRRAIAIGIDGVGVIDIGARLEQLQAAGHEGTLTWLATEVVLAVVALAVTVVVADPPVVQVFDAGSFGAKASVVAVVVRQALDGALRLLLICGPIAEHSGEEVAIIRLGGQGAACVVVHRLASTDRVFTGRVSPGALAKRFIVADRACRVRLGTVRRLEAAIGAVAAAESISAVVALTIIVAVASRSVSAIGDALTIEAEGLVITVDVVVTGPKADRLVLLGLACAEDRSKETASIGLQID